MKTLFKLLPLLLFLSLVSCNSSSSTEKETPEEVNQVKEEAENTDYKELYFDSSSEWPDHHKFAFTSTPGGEDYVFIHVDKSEEEGTSVPANLIAPETGEEEGLSGENPAMVGRLFKVYDIKGDRASRAELIPNKDKIQILYYQSCAVYAGKVDYAFTRAPESEDYIFVTGPALGEENTDIPENLIEPETEDLEGVPGENPEMVGKAFMVYFNADDIPYKIEAID